MRKLWIPILFALGSVGGCSKRDAAASTATPTSVAGQTPPAAKAGPTFPAQLPHSRDPRVAACAVALETGDLSLAQRLLLELADLESPDTTCLRARLLSSQGDQIAAVRELEQARRTWPNQGALYATAAEIHAASGRLESANDEIRAGLASAGPTADLSRARGVLCLLQQGGAKLGLAHLLEALKADPELLFCKGPLSEAHRLLATAALAKSDARGALGHAREGLKLEPDNADLRLLCADALVAAGDFDAGLPAYEELARGGRDLGAALRLYYQKGATMALVEGRSEVAFARYLRARQLGATNEELGLGAEILGRAVASAQATADKAYAEERLDDARKELERLLVIEPLDLAARTQLGLVCFKLKDFASASAAWRGVLEIAETSSVKLPEPVHLNLARSLYAEGKNAEIKQVCEQYLAKEPDGEWSAQTREMLERLSR